VSQPESRWQDGDVACFTDPATGEKQVAIRRDRGWNRGEWQVAAHGERRETDEFMTMYGIRMVPEK